MPNEIPTQIVYCRRHGAYYPLIRLITIIVRFVGVASVDIDFETIDINQCPLSLGNPGPNDYAGTADCTATQICQPLPGYGFRRGGYTCVERSELAKRQAPNDNLLQVKDSVSPSNCGTKTREELRLPSTMAAGVEKVFINQARSALRLSHFISMFLQTVRTQGKMYYSSLRGDKFLNIDQLFGEVIANVMSDKKVVGSGVFFDKNQFQNPDGTIREFFGPLAYRSGDNNNYDIQATDMAGLNDSYVNEPYFTEAKTRWQSSTKRLDTFSIEALIRADHNAQHLRPLPDSPLHYKGPKLDDGVWSGPEYYCSSRLGSGTDSINNWVVTYSVPFFGPTYASNIVDVKGVVSVMVKLDDLK